MYLIIANECDGKIIDLKHNEIFRIHKFDDFYVINIYEITFKIMSKLSVDITEIIKWYVDFISENSSITYDVLKQKFEEQISEQGK